MTSRATFSAEGVALLALICVMALVVLGFAALSLTSSERVCAAHPLARAVVTGGWLLLVVAGWIAVVWIITRAPGGADTLWVWARSQPRVAQTAFWLLLLPWTTSVWIWQSGWQSWLKVAAVLTLALTTIGLAAGQYAQAARRLRG
jgi:hypothetical protein